MKKQSKGPYQVGTIVPINLMSKKHINIGQQATKKTEHYILTGKVIAIDNIIHLRKDSVEYDNGYRYNSVCQMEVQNIKQHD